MNIVGLDLSLTGTGIATKLATVTIKGPADRGDWRLVDIAAYLNRLHVMEEITLAVIEDVATNAKMYSIAPVLVHGAVRLWLLTNKIPYVLVGITTLKAFATGKGGASKTDMAMAAFKRAGREFADDNQCDAWWLRQAALHFYGTPEFDLPAAQRARLDKVAWPQLMEIAL